MKPTVSIPQRRISKKLVEEQNDLNKDVEAKIQKAFNERKRQWQEKS